VEISTPIYSPDGRLLVVVLQDLTVYASQLTLENFNAAVRLFGEMCPPESWQMYKLRETVVWDNVRRPLLLPEAVATYDPYPFVESVRRRIRDGRRVEFRLWDRHSPQCWAFTCWRDYINGEEHVFYRYMAPFHTDPAVLKNAAVALGNQIELLSGHGGYSFAYDASTKYSAFADIYRLARRLWCVDVEDLNLTLPLMTKWIKGVSWLTFISHPFIGQHGLAPSLLALKTWSNLEVEYLTNGVLVVTGERPIAGDIHHDFGGLEPYFDVAAVLRPLFPPDPPPFPGWYESEVTTRAWFQRFLNKPG
jgi:hypothetical protein